MRVEATKQAAFGRTGAMPSHASPAGADHDTGSRALVVVTPAAPRQQATNFREAEFLAHLIATKDHAPQTRDRRRGEPYEAIAAYRATVGLMRD